MNDQSRVHLLADRLELVFERGDDAEVPSASSKPPEEVRVLRLARSTKPAVGRDNLRGNQAVDGQAKLATQPSKPSTESQPGDPRTGDDSGRNRRAVLRGGAVHVRKQTARFYPHG